MSQGSRQKLTSAAGGTTVGFQGARLVTTRASLILLCCAAKPQGNNREVWAGGRVVAGLPQQGPRDREEQGATGKGPPEALWRSLPDHIHLVCCGLLCRVLCSRQCRSVFSSALAMNLQALYGVRPQGAWIYFPTLMCHNDSRCCLASSLATCKERLNACSYIVSHSQLLAVSPVLEGRDAALQAWMCQRCCPRWASIQAQPARRWAQQP